MNFVFAFGYFTVLVGLFLDKLIPLWSSAIPGGLEDTRLFLWNAWWFHHAVSVLHTNPYRTLMLFYPFGCRLISHDFPLWMNLITFAGQASGLSMIAASNLWFALSWILLGFCTYGLAVEVTGEPLAGMAAGTLAMTHSYTLARAMQNWGQFNAYGIALFLWCLVRARRKKTAGAFALAGIALAWTAACHYYFLIYSVLIWLAVAAVDLLPYSFHIRPSSPADSGGGPIRRLLLGLAVLAGAIGIGILIHPGIVHIGRITIGMQNPDNILFVMWILLMILGATYLRLELLPHRWGKAGMGVTAVAVKDVKQLYHHLVLLGTATLLLFPLFWESFNLIRGGGYPKQSILWKTHPMGANLLALFMPNPLHAIWGPAVSRWFSSRLMNPQEQAASVGWVCIAVIAVSRLWQGSERSRRWLSLAVAATVLAMGTHLHIAQYNLWCPLPFFWFKLLPVLGNVRIPERWMAVGAIAWSVVLALALTRLAAARGWSLRKAAILVTALILVENWPGIPFQAPPPVRPIYERLRDLPPGAILPIPLYIGDSSIGTGNAINGEFTFPWDDLWAQITHQKPIIGGYIGRIPRQIIDSYKTDPFIHKLLDLEEGKIHNHPADPAFGEYALRNLDFRYVLVYPKSTDPETLKYVLDSLPLELIDQDNSVRLYKINPS